MWLPELVRLSAKQTISDEQAMVSGVDAWDH
jgi:UDP-N-acetylglucosamine enolpyruvyl transferase